MAVTISKDGVTGYVYLKADVDTDTDPTGNAVHMALTARGVTPVATEWVAGSWDGAAVPIGTGSRGVAQCKAGEGQALDQPGDGIYSCWLKITTADEVVIRHAGIVKIEGN